MKNHEPMSPDARCLSCGYQLRGLPEAVCPECARAFDPLDPTTFDGDPSRRRRRKWIVRSCVVLALVVMLFGLGPRRVMTGAVTFTCKHCLDKQTVKRWELMPPRWIPVRYPGIGWRQVTADRTVTENARKCAKHFYDVNVRADIRVGKCSLTCRPGLGDIVTVNGRITTPRTAPAVLKSLMAPSSMGITISEVPAPGHENE